MCISTTYSLVESRSTFTCHKGKKDIKLMNSNKGVHEHHLQPGRIRVKVHMSQGERVNENSNKHKGMHEHNLLAG